MNRAKKLQLGKINRLQIVKDSAYGLFLDGYEHGEILLPKRYVTPGSKGGDWLEVFVYADSEDRLVATSERPRAMVGDVAYLKVAAVNEIGAFMDWGLPKDILAPFAEQAQRMRPGYSYCVYLYVDRHNDRIVASSKLSKFLPEQSRQHRQGQQVELLVCAKSELGFKCLVDRSFLALLHHGDVFVPLDPGRELNGYIKNIRPDGRIDLSLSPVDGQSKDDLESLILQYLEAQGGNAALGDKSPPEEIYKLFQTSKKNFKRALGKLYKSKKIIIDSGQISLISP
jgi:uncharacterized protein